MTSPRPLSDREREILDFLLSDPDERIAPLRAQAETATVTACASVAARRSISTSTGPFRRRRSGRRQLKQAPARRPAWTRCPTLASSCSWTRGFWTPSSSGTSAVRRHPNSHRPWPWRSLRFLVEGLATIPPAHGNSRGRARRMVDSDGWGLGLARRPEIHARAEYRPLAAEQGPDERAGFAVDSAVGAARPPHSRCSARPHGTLTQ